MEAALRAIAEPRRRQILELVRERELSAGEIAARFDVTRPAISQHLGVLREAGLIEERREGKRLLFRTREAGLEPVRAWLGAFWSDRLEALRMVAEAEARDAPQEEHRG